MMKIICPLFFFFSLCAFAHDQNYVHEDFYRGLAGIKQEVDNINRDLLILENATLSKTEMSQRFTQLDQRIDFITLKLDEISRDKPTNITISELKQIEESLEILDMKDIQSRIQPHIDQQHRTITSEALLASRDFTNETIRYLATSAVAMSTLVVAIISVIIAWTNHLQTSRTKRVEEQAEDDLNTLKDSTHKELNELKHNTQSQIDLLTGKHEKEIQRLESLNLEKVQSAENALDTLMSETETQNGLIFKNLAVSIYLRRYVIEDGYERFFDKLESTTIDRNTTPRYNPSILREIIAIQEHAISRFEKVKDKLPDARMFFYEALRDLAFYETEMTRYGKLSQGATKRINENLIQFEQNLVFWLDKEHSKYNKTERIPRFIYRVICMVDSLLFIQTCLLKKQLYNKESAFAELYGKVDELLSKKYHITSSMIEDILSGQDCSDLWKKYNNFKIDRPRLF